MHKPPSGRLRPFHVSRLLEDVISENQQHGWLTYDDPPPTPEPRDVQMAPGVPPPQAPAQDLKGLLRLADGDSRLNMLKFVVPVWERAGPTWDSSAQQWTDAGGYRDPRSKHLWGSSSGHGVHNVGMQMKQDGPGWAGLGLPPSRGIDRPVTSRYSPETLGLRRICGSPRAAYRREHHHHQMGAVTARNNIVSRLSHVASPPPSRGGSTQPLSQRLGNEECEPSAAEPEAAEAPHVPGYLRGMSHLTSPSPELPPAGPQAAGVPSPRAAAPHFLPAAVRYTHSSSLRPPTGPKLPVGPPSWSTQWQGTRSPKALMADQGPSFTEEADWSDLFKWDPEDIDVVIHQPPDAAMSKRKSLVKRASIMARSAERVKRLSGISYKAIDQASMDTAPKPTADEKEAQRKLQISRARTFVQLSPGTQPDSLGQGVPSPHPTSPQVQRAHRRTSMMRQLMVPGTGSLGIVSSSTVTTVGFSDDLADASRTWGTETKVDIGFKESPP